MMRQRDPVPPKIETGRRSSKRKPAFRRPRPQISAYNETIIRPIDPADLPHHVRVMMAQQGLRYLTRNSKCPCGSGKRYKRCHGAK